MNEELMGNALRFVTQQVSDFLVAAQTAHIMITEGRTKEAQLVLRNVLVKYFPESWKMVNGVEALNDERPAD